MNARHLVAQPAAGARPTDRPADGRPVGRRVEDAPVAEVNLGSAASLISAIVLARDEAANIEPCLRTLRWASERIVIVDSRTRDDTAQLAPRAGARVVTQHFADWASQRNFAIAQAARRWVLFIDADERVPLALADEILERVARAERDGSPSGFWLPRQNLILGQWVRHAGWSPDAQLRLFRTDRGRYDPQRLVHELVQLDGESETLAHLLVHHNYASWGQFWTKQVRYALTDARAQVQAGVRVKPQNFALQPLREFRRRYWELGGYRDGTLGLTLSLLLAVATFITYCEMARLQLRLGGLIGT